MKKSDMLRWSPLIGLLVGVLAATWIALDMTRQNELDVQESFQLVAQRASLQLERRVGVYEYGLRGARGALISGGEEFIGRQGFARYSASRDYAKEFPGARGFGFIRRVQPSEESAFVQAAQADGWPDFSIRQLSPHSGERYVIQYIEPLENNEPAVGLDIASESNRRSAALRALRTGAATITDPITLVQANGKRNQGFLILLPAYRANAVLKTESDRVAAGYGWVYTPLVVEEVLQDFDYYDGRIDISVSALDESGKIQEFYASSSMVGSDTRLPHITKRTVIYGKEWLIKIQAKPAFIEQLNLNSPWLAFGLILSLSLAGTIATYWLQQANARFAHMESENKLNRINRRYRQLIDGVKDYAIIQLDPEGKVTGWNSGAENLEGHSSQEILGQHFSVFYAHEDFEAGHLERKLAAAFHNGSEHDEGWLVRKDGTRFWATTTLTPIYDEDGHLSGYSMIARDLSERRASEMELNRLFGLQNAILNNAGVAIIATQMDGIITLFNPSAERLLGYPGDEVIGKLTPAAFHDRQEIADRAKALSEELGKPVKPGLAALGAKALLGEVDTQEWTYITKTGQRTPVLLSVTGIFDESGNPLGTVGLAADLSEQKRHQAELVAAREAAERANVAKSSFLANMSHEIRTPMNAILGMTQLALQGTLDRHQRSLLEKAFAASKALLSILNDVLDYSKVEAGHMQLESRELSLESVLANSASLFTHQAEQKGLEFILDIPPDLPENVVGDPLRLTQVLSNLLSNALKFTAQGSVRLAARVTRCDANHCRVRFSIADSGIGMSPSQVTQLFRPFTQADISVTRKYGGTGLGLSICKRLVELMGGSIEVSSEREKGSEFFFEIDMPLVSPQKSEQGGRAKLPFQRALIVDDQVAAAHVLQVMLHSWGIESECSASGSDAMQRIKEASTSGHPFDLLLTDWQMPQMDGLQLVDGIQELAVSHTLDRAPVVLMISVHSREDIKEQLNGRHVSAVLTKPVLPSALHNALAEISHTQPVVPHADQRPTPAIFDSYIASAAPLHGKHVLLAEDNEVNQQVATAFLQSAGLEVSVACNGIQAVELAQSGRFAAVLMDMHMPEMDGLEATRKIRSIPDLAKTPIIAMTAAVMQEDQRACFDAGMDDFVSKPIDPDELINVLCKWVGTLGHLNTPATQPGTRPGANEPPDDLQALADVQGLDVPGALARMGGNRDLCARLLLDFADRARALAKELETTALSELPASIHKLKGEGANLGISPVSKACQAVEDALKTIPGQFPTMEVRQVCQSLQAISQQMLQTMSKRESPFAPSASKSAVLVDHDEVNSLMDSLPPLLKNQRMEAIKKSQRIHDLLKGSNWSGPYQPVHAQITQLQFAAALVALEQFKTRFERAGN